MTIGRLVALSLLIVVAISCNRSTGSGSGEHSSHESKSETRQPVAATAEPRPDHVGHGAGEGAEGGRAAPLAAADHGAHGAPPGLAPVMLDGARRQQLGVRTARVENRSFERDLRLSGSVRVDETKQSHVHLKFMGFVEKVFVNFVGRPVKKGEPLLTVYSPDLLSATSEYAQALSALSKISEGPFAAAERKQTQALIDAAKARLVLLDVPQEEIARLEATGTPARTLTLRSPLSGTVLAREVVDGMRVMPDMTLFVIADLRAVWVLADVFESDLRSVKQGDHAVIRFAGAAAPDREGRVAFIAPTLNEATRTAQVRIEVPNEDGAVRPGLFADVTLQVLGVAGLAVPDAAVIETGTRSIGFVETAPGRFEPRELHVGARAGGYVRVLHGVHEGEQVAVSAQFLLDAESQIRGSAAPGGHGGH